MRISSLVMLDVRAEERDPINVCPHAIAHACIRAVRVQACQGHLRAQECLAMKTVRLIVERIAPARLPKPVARIARFCPGRRHTPTLLLSIDLIANLVEVKSHPLVVRCAQDDDQTTHLH